MQLCILSENREKSIGGMLKFSGKLANNLSHLPSKNHCIEIEKNMWVFTYWFNYLIIKFQTDQRKHKMSYFY